MTTPIEALASSRKAVIVAVGMVSVVALFIAGAVLKVPWPQTTTVIGSITALLYALVHGISMEDAAAKAAPSAVGTMNVTNPPPPMPLVSDAPGFAAGVPPRSDPWQGRR